MFQPKFALISPQLQEQIIQEAREFGHVETAKKWYEKIGMSKDRLMEILKKKITPQSPVQKTDISGGKKQGQGKQRNLTKEEKTFLEGLKNGTVGLGETSKFVAVRVFENMLRNPYQWAYLDFFRTELLRLKSEETQLKDQWAKEIISRFFAGKLPPRHCPKCGESLSENKVLEGKVIDEPRLPAHI